MSNILVTEALVALNIENYRLEGNPENEAEFNAAFVKFTGKDSDEVAIESTNPSDFGVTWNEITTKMEALVTEKPLQELREERNSRLAESDWMVLPDRTSTQAQLDYRQSLRDITNTYGSLETVVWPVKP